MGAAPGLTLLVVSGATLPCGAGVSHSGGSSLQVSVVVVHGLSCPTICGNFLDWGWNLCPLHRQADS